MTSNGQDWIDNVNREIERDRLHNQHRHEELGDLTTRLGSLVARYYDRAADLEVEVENLKKQHAKEEESAAMKLWSKDMTIDKLKKQLSESQEEIDYLKTKLGIQETE